MIYFCNPINGTQYNFHADNPGQLTVNGIPAGIPVMFED